MADVYTAEKGKGGRFGRMGTPPKMMEGK